MPQAPALPLWESTIPRFITKARELGCDEDEAAFEARQRTIAKAPAPKDAKPKVTKPKRAKVIQPSMFGST
jgi:hypothetical protein